MLTREQFERITKRQDDIIAELRLISQLLGVIVDRETTKPEVTL